MKTALITGLSGFTGRYLAAELVAAGYNVHGTISGNKTLGKQNYPIDLKDQEAVRELITKIKPDVVIHLAAISFVAHENMTDIYQTNILGTLNILESLASCRKIPKIVLLASSASVYGNMTINPICEKASTNPLSHYAVSKLAMEKMAFLWMDKLPITIVRPFNYTGIGQSLKFLLPKIVDHYRQGKKEIELGNLDVARDFSDVRIVVRAYAKLIEAMPVGEVFNICSGKAHSLRQIIAMMTEVSGREIEVKVNTNFVRKKEVKLLCGSNVKLAKVIGSMDAIPLQETLRWMYLADNS